MQNLIRHILSDFCSRFARLFLLSGGSYLLTIALPFLMHDLFRSLDTEAFYGAALAVGVYFLFTPFYERWASLRRRELGVDIRSNLDRYFYKTLQDASPAGRSAQGIVALPFFESYSAQYSVLVFFPDLFWLALALCGFVAAAIMQLGGAVTAVIAGACTLYIVLSLRNVKVIGTCYYKLLDIEKNRVGILSAVVKGFGAFSSGRFLPVVTKALAEVRKEQRRWLTKRAWLQAWNETLIRGFFIVLFSAVILTLSHSAVDLDAVSLLVLSLCLNVLLNLLDDAISTIRVLYNVVLVDRKARRIMGLTSRDSHNTPAQDTLEGIVGITAKDSQTVKDLLAQAVQDKALTIGDKSYALQGRVGYTNQTAFLVSGSIRYNIVFEADCSEEQLNAVLHRYQLLDDVAGFPEGIDKDVGAHGANLSTGQRVRVALARLDVQGYDTIILDDVFSSLNPAVSRTIQNIWRQEKQPHHTIVFMSSNASHYDWADVVIDCDSHDVLRQNHDHLDTSALPPNLQQQAKTQVRTETKAEVKANAKAGSSTKTNTDPEKAGFHAFAALRKFFGFGTLALLVLLIGGEVFADIEIAKVLTEWRSTSSISFDHTVFYLLGLLAVTALAAKNILVFFHGLARSQAMHSSHVGAVLGLSPQRFGRHDWGFYLNRLGNDFKAVEMTTPGFLAKLVFSVIATVAGTIFLVTLNPFLVALFVPLVAISSIVYRRYRQRVLSSTEAFAASRQPVISFVMETDERDLDIIASDLGGWARQRFAALVTARENAHKAYWHDAIAMDTVTTLFLNGVVVAVLVVVAVSHATGMYSAMSMLALFFVLSFRKEVGGLVGNLKSVETNLTALSRLDQVSPGALAGHGVAPMEVVVGDCPSLVLEGVTCVQGTETVLEGFSARFEAGKPTLVVGRTGCGKSTMLAAIHGDVALQAGALTLTAPSSGTRLSPRVALVRPTSLSWDIAVGELLELDGFGADKVAGFLRDGAEPGWLDAVKDKNLSALSHGDRQLLELARLLAQDPQVVLLDEAFTSLPPAMERRVLTALIRHYPQAVILYVSHRPDNVAGLFPRTLDMAPS